jgi:hypothetical protein
MQKLSRFARSYTFFLVFGSEKEESKISYQAINLKRGNNHAGPILARACPTISNHLKLRTRFIRQLSAFACRVWLVQTMAGRLH